MKSFVFDGIKNSHANFNFGHWADMKKVLCKVHKNKNILYKCSCCLFANRTSSAAFDLGFTARRLIHFGKAPLEVDRDSGTDVWSVLSREVNL